MQKFNARRGVFKALLLLPSVVILAIFMYYPIEETFRLSFAKASGLGDFVYIGFANYIKLFQTDEFLAALFHNFQWIFWSLIIQIPLAFFVAYSLIAFKNKITGPLRSVYYLANILPSAIVAMVAIFLFSPRNGIFATIGDKFQIDWLQRIDFLGDPNLAFWSVFAMATWAYSGFGIIYLMANIEQIPTEIRDAAQIDGANRWQYARIIVLPMISYPIRILALLSIVGSLKVFDLPYLITHGGPGDATKTLGTVLYQEGFVNQQYGKAAAVGVVIFLLSLIFTVLQFTLRSKDEGEAA